MKIDDLTEDQCKKIAEKKPTWLVSNHPEYMSKHCPEYIPLNLREVPEEIVELLK